MFLRGEFYLKAIQINSLIKFKISWLESLNENGLQE